MGAGSSSEPERRSSRKFITEIADFDFREDDQESRGWIHNNNRTLGQGWKKQEIELDPEEDWQWIKEEV